MIKKIYVSIKKKVFLYKKAYRNCNTIEDETCKNGITIKKIKMTHYDDIKSISYYKNFRKISYL
jgi:hypothetical protein